MPRYRKSYSLYRRKVKDGKNVYYYRTYDDYGNRTPGRSTGETSKTRAENYCNQLIKEGRLVPAKEVAFSQYAKDWWIWDRCPYIRGKILRQENGRRSISHSYADDQRRILELYVAPNFGRYRLSTINPKMIEDFMFALSDKGLSHKRVNNIVGTLRVMMGEAQRLRYIQKKRNCTNSPNNSLEDCPQRIFSG